MIVGHGFRADARVSVADRAVLGNRVTIGSDTRIGTGASLANDVTIGDSALLGKNVVVARRAVIGPLALLEEGARIGHDATIEMGAKVGRRAVVSPRCRRSGRHLGAARLDCSLGRAPPPLSASASSPGRPIERVVPVVERSRDELGVLAPIADLQRDLTPRRPRRAPRPYSRILESRVARVPQPRILAVAIRMRSAGSSWSCPGRPTDSMAIAPSSSTSRIWDGQDRRSRPLLERLR